MIKILIVDDQTLIRLGLANLFLEERGVSVVGDAASGEEGIRKTRELKPDIILIDIDMPGLGGLEATRRIHLMEHHPRVIVVTSHKEEPYPSQAMKAGATGYVTKTAARRELVNAVRKVFVGQRYISRDVAQQLAFRNLDDEATCPFEHLSNREMQIALMVVQCQKVQDISNNLCLSPKTVNSYRYRIFEKLKVSSDVALALLAVRYGMIDPHHQQVA